MTKKYVLFVSAILLLLNLPTRADEGMWLPLLIQKFNIQKMQQMGCKLSADDIYNINKSSLKDAIIRLDNGSCTAELISDEGLLLTNHHCGYDDIQKHSSLEHDYLKNGFWAKTKAEELTNPNKTASLLVRMEDVSEQFLPALKGINNEWERDSIVKTISAKISQQAQANNGYEASVEELFEGNAFYLFVYETFRDVRLVGAPPSSIGKFGGDTDNWMWPRHTGDFSIFRIYCSPDGKPAEYSDKNVPYKPKKSLTISLKGIKKNDFTMVMGYPGNTERYLSSFGVDETYKINNPIRIDVRNHKLDIIKKSMSASDLLRIQYSSKYSVSSNYWKYSIGQNGVLKDGLLLKQKQEMESKLKEWVEADAKRKEKFGDFIDVMKTTYQDRALPNKTVQYINEAAFEGPEILLLPYNTVSYYEYLHKLKNLDSLPMMEDKLKDLMAKKYKDFDLETDKKLFVDLLSLYKKNVDSTALPSIYDEIEKNYEGDIQKFADEFYQNSLFASKEKFDSFIGTPANEVFFTKSPVLKTGVDLVNLYNMLQNDSRNYEKIEQMTSYLKLAKMFYFKKGETKEEFKKSFTEFFQKVPEESRPDIFDVINRKFDGNISLFIDSMFAKSICTDTARFNRFMARPSNETVYASNLVFQFANLSNTIAFILKSTPDDKTSINEEVKNLKQNASVFFDNFDSNSGKDKMIKDFVRHYGNLEKSLRPDIFNLIDSKYKGDITKFINAMFDKSIFTDKKRFESFLDKPKLKTLESDFVYQTYKSLSSSFKSTEILNDYAVQTALSTMYHFKQDALYEDPAFKLMVSFIRIYSQTQEKLDSINKVLKGAKRSYIAALMEKEGANAAFYPDANSTMRMSYGKVADYESNGKPFQYYTTLKGIIEKEKPGDDEFDVPAKLKELYTKKDFGQYASGGDVPVCFISTNDITGGNSGSPVLNGNGELVGLAFDGNWEGMSSDIQYDINKQRTIICDIRYVLFIIDKFAGAKNLISEMKFAK